MIRITVLSLTIAALALSLSACGQEGEEKTKVIKLQKHEANLPPVPTIPAVNVPETYSDRSYSLYGLRRNKARAINTVVEVTAYVAKMYEKPNCPEGQTCPALMPHLYLAHEPNEPIAKRQMRLVGWAQNFQEIEDAKSGKERELPEGIELPPVVHDWEVGRKYKITAMFTRMSSAGFQDTEGLLDYKNHQCLDCPEDPKKK